MNTRWALVVDGLEPFRLDVNENLNTKLRCDNFFVVFYIVNFSIFFVASVAKFLSFAAILSFFVSSLLLCFDHWAWFYTFDSIFYLLKWSNLNMRLFFFFLLFMLHCPVLPIRNSTCCFFPHFDMRIAFISVECFVRFSVIIFGDNKNRIIIDLKRAMNTFI